MQQAFDISLLINQRHKISVTNCVKAMEQWPTVIKKGKDKNTKI